MKPLALADRAWWLGQGQYCWQDPGTMRSIKNIGTTLSTSSSSS